MNQRITTQKQRKVIKQAKVKLYLGQDSNEKLNHFSQTAISKLMQIYNQTYSRGICPQIWNEAAMKQSSKK